MERSDNHAFFCSFNKALSDLISDHFKRERVRQLSGKPVNKSSNGRLDIRPGRLSGPYCIPILSIGVDI